MDDCLIHDIGLVEKQATGVQVSMAKGITIRHCSIYDVGRAGINFSEGTFGGHLIEFCDVFDTVRETGDHGSFNSWGRDRFWGLRNVPEGEMPTLALLDTEKSIIRNSRWRCDHGWDIDLDDGSSNYEIYNNLLLSGGLKLREGFHRKVYNNITVNNSLHPHVWYKDSGDEVTRNIWMTVYRPARMKYWGRLIDHNLFLRDGDRDKFRENGIDRNSIAGNPMFVDPANGDFRVKDGSPALAIGFKNFPMDRFGVRNPTLKAMARTPKLPKLNLRGIAAAEVKTVSWRGITLKALSGEEFSAFGANKEDGGMHVLEVPENSPYGLLVDDLVQKLNGRKVSDRNSFLAAARAVPEGESPVFVVVRQQNSLTVNPAGTD